MSNYVFSNTENISVSSSVANFLNIHPKITHPGNQTDVVTSNNISLKNLGELSNKNFYSPNITNGPVSVQSFKDTSFMSVEVYSERSDIRITTNLGISTYQSVFNGNVFIRPRYGSGKYSLSWKRSQDTIFGSIGTTQVIGPRNSGNGTWYPGIGSIQPIQVFSTLPPFNDNRRAYIYETQIFNKGSSNWSGLKIEITNLNEINTEQKNYLVAGTLVGKWSTGVNGTYIDPITNNKLYEIKNWENNKGSASGVAYYNLDVNAGKSITLRHQVTFNKLTCTNCATRILPGNIPKKVELPPLTFKFTPIVKNPTGMSVSSEVTWPGDTFAGENYQYRYFEEGKIISTAIYIPPEFRTDPAVDFQLNAAQSKQRGDIEFQVSKDATKEQVLSGLRSSLLGGHTVYKPVEGIGYPGKYTPPGGPAFNSLVDYTVNFKLTDVETGQCIFFGVQIGVKETNKSYKGGWCSWTSGPPLELDPNVPTPPYVDSYNNKQYFQEYSLPFEDNFDEYRRSNPIILNYPGDDRQYTNYSISPFW